MGFNEAKSPNFRRGSEEVMKESLKMFILAISLILLTLFIGNSLNFNLNKITKNISTTTSSSSSSSNASNDQKIIQNGFCTFKYASEEFFMYGLLLCDN